MRVTKQSLNDEFVKILTLVTNFDLRGCCMFRFRDPLIIDKNLVRDKDLVFFN